tara:strand:+ start:623 stop:964 length:342 start_codon:yes stop_codon:yes gene_type:complete
MSKIIVSLFAALSLAFLHSPALSQDRSGPVIDLQTWNSLSKQERQAIVLAAVEALFLAASADSTFAEAIDQQCLASLTPNKIEDRIRDQAKNRPNAPFSQVFLEVATCEEEDD